VFAIICLLVYGSYACENECVSDVIFLLYMIAVCCVCCVLMFQWYVVLAVMLHVERVVAPMLRAGAS